MMRPTGVCVCVCVCAQMYVKSQDKEFAATTIQAIGRCATNISEITDACLNGLVLLLSSQNGNHTHTKQKTHCALVGFRLERH